MSAIVVTLFENGSTSAVPVELGSLTDVREHGILGLGGDETRNVQIVQKPEATEVEVFDRSNRQESITLNVVKLHASLAEAFRWWLLHPRSCPIKVDAQFTQDGAEEWLVGCGIPRVSRVDRPSGGLTTIFAYELVGGAWAPTRAGSYSDPGLA